MNQLKMVKRSHKHCWETRDKDPVVSHSLSQKLPDSKFTEFKIKPSITCELNSFNKKSRPCPFSSPSFCHQNHFQFSLRSKHSRTVQRAFLHSGCAQIGARGTNQRSRGGGAREGTLAYKPLNFEKMPSGFHG